MSAPGKAPEADVIGKIRKLHALAEGATNEAEAALAATRAQELLIKYNLNLGSVLLKEDPGATETVGRKWRRIPAYSTFLAFSCDELFDVKHYLRGSRGTGRAFVFIGLKANVETACITYEYLMESLDALACGAKGAGLIYGGEDFLGFRIGAAMRILDIAREQKTKTLAANPGYGELVYVGQAVAQRLYDAVNFTFSLGGSGGGFSAFGRAFKEGYQQGDRVDLHGARTNRMLKGGGQ